MQRLIGTGAEGEMNDGNRGEVPVVNSRVSTPVFVDDDDVGLGRVPQRRENGENMQRMTDRRTDGRTL